MKNAAAGGPMANWGEFAGYELPGKFAHRWEITAAGGRDGSMDKTGALPLHELASSALFRHECRTSPGRSLAEGMEANRVGSSSTLSPRQRGLLLALLSAVGLLAGGRVAQLACGSLASQPSSNSSAGEASETVAVTPTAAPAAMPQLTGEEIALLAMACPSAIEQLPAELRPHFERGQLATQNKLAPPHRLLARREPGEGWLVDPEAWYVPEDRANEPVAAAPTTPEPTGPPPEQLDSPNAQPSAAPPTEPELPDLPLPNLPLPNLEAPKPVRPEPELPEPTVPELQLPAEDQPAAPPEGAAVEQPREPLQETAVDTLPAPLEETGASARAEAEGARAGVGNASAVEAPLSEPDRPQPPREPEIVSPPVAEPPPAAAPSAGEPLFAPPAPVATPPAPAKPTFVPPPLSTPPTAAPAPAPVVPSLSPHSTPAKPLSAAQQQAADESHRELFAKNCYPSARDCAKCHKKQYEEWSVSSHAYAFVSPMFHKFEQKITNLSQGTVGYFCTRCHSPVAVAMCESRDTPLWEMAEVAREGVTCIACHRVNERYAKTNGERRVVPGDIHAPVYGSIGGDGVAAAIADKSKYKVKTSPGEKGAGQAIHTEGRFFEHLAKAEFCTACHQVAVHPGIKLEVVWDQYRASPACKKGVTCQHCHMGVTPGVASPYEVTSIAEVGGKSVNTQRQHANHTFYGPGYSIAHPGIFPFHEKGNRWRIDEWLTFDWRAGWGTDDFEDAVADGKCEACFPKVWQESDDRCDAREIIEDNLERLKKKRDLRSQVMEHGSKVDGPFFRQQPCRGQDLKFDYVVTNLNEGHNLPTASLGAQPQLWANVVLIGPDGRRLWETGYTDRYGDLADIHSEEVRAGRVPFDSQLFNLQTMFLITGATGTDREFFLPVNVSIDQVPQLRPGALPISVLNHPPFIRMESRSIAPLGSKRVKYKVPGELIRQPGRYRLSFRLRNRTEPMYFMRFCESTLDMQRSMNEGILDIHPYSVEFVVK